MHRFMKITAFALVVCLMVSLALPGFAASAKMKKANVKWDLKSGKTYTISTKYTGYDELLKADKCKIKTSVKNSATKGYKELTCTITFTPILFTKTQVHNIVQSRVNIDENGKGKIGGTIGYWIIDYASGYSLESENKYGVTVESSVSYSEEYQEKDNDGCWITRKTCNANLVITYPSTYKDLCIGIGGKDQVLYTKYDTRFGNGACDFTKTSYNSSGTFHFMRVK